MNKVLLFSCLMLALVVFAPDAVAADCQDCRDDADGGLMCWSGEGGSYGACWEEGDGDSKHCEGSTCTDDGGGDGAGGGGGEQPGGGGGPDDQQDPACNGLFGCSAECSSCWY